MNEQEWLTSKDPKKMLEFLWSHPSWFMRHSVNRKLRLFFCALCRQIFPQLTDKHSQRAVEVAERYADYRRVNNQTSTQSNAPSRRLLIWQRIFEGTYGGGPPEHGWLLVHFALADSYIGIPNAISNTYRYVPPETQAILIRDLFGNLYQHDSWARKETDLESHGFIEGEQPGLLGKKNNSLFSMAQHIYRSHDFAATPVLADALEEAGWTDQRVLGHLRSGQLHARGCWILDYLLKNNY